MRRSRRYAPRSSPRAPESFVRRHPVVFNLVSAPRDQGLRGHCARFVPPAVRRRNGSTAVLGPRRPFRRCTRRPVHLAAPASRRSRLGIRPQNPSSNTMCFPLKAIWSVGSSSWPSGPLGEPSSSWRCSGRTRRSESHRNRRARPSVGQWLHLAPLRCHGASDEDMVMKSRAQYGSK